MLGLFNSKELMDVPKSKRASFGDRAFKVAGPKLWNTMPQSLREISKLNMFKAALKTLLFRKAFEL